MVSTDIKNIDDVKQELKVFWGALTSFQVQLHSINGAIEDIHTLIKEALCDLREMDSELSIIKREMKNI